MSRLLVSVFVAMAFVASPAMAAKPDDAGKGKGNGNKAKVEQSHKAKPGKGGKDHGKHASSHADGDIHDIIRDFYSNEFKSGHCPPGLAKKNNGCLPPGQAKKWKVGHVLPGDVIYHDLPDELLRRLGRTPEGYKLVRVGADILKIGVGSGMVIEAVEDLSELF